MRGVDPNGRQIEIGCTVYAPWPRCSTLPVNQTFPARMEKDGLQMRYLDEHHKWRTENYDLLNNQPSGQWGMPLF